MQRSCRSEHVFTYVYAYYLTCRCTYVLTFADGCLFLPKLLCLTGRNIRNYLHFWPEHYNYHSFSIYPTKHWFIAAMCGIVFREYKYQGLQKPNTQHLLCNIYHFMCKHMS